VGATPSTRTAIIWAEPAQAPWLRAATERAGLTIIGAGGPLQGRSSDLVAGLTGHRDSAAAYTDLRTVLATASTDLILIAAPGDFAGGQRQGSLDREDAAALATARARGVRIATLEPMPCSALQLGIPAEVGGTGAASIGNEMVGATGWAGMGGPGVMLGPGGPAHAVEPSNVQPQGSTRNAAEGGTLAGAGGGWASLVPLMRASRAMRDAADVLEQFGQVRTVLVECWCRAGQGTLGARLFDAMDCIVSLLGVPEQVDATYVWPVSGHALHAAAGESLRGLEGDLTANMRFAGGRAAAVALSDRASRWSRSVTILGDGGRLRISDDGVSGDGIGPGGFVWLSADGQTVDASRPVRRKRGQEDRPDEALVDALADQLARILDPRAPVPGATDYPGVLAAGGAALLSARTGESESSETILRMAGAQ